MVLHFVSGATCNAPAWHYTARIAGGQGEHGERGGSRGDGAGKGGRQVEVQTDTVKRSNKRPVAFKFTRTCMASCWVWPPLAPPPPPPPGGRGGGGGGGAGVKGSN